MATAALGLIGPLMSGLAGLFGGGTQQTTNTSGTSTQNQQYNNSGSTTPNLNPLQQQLAKMFSQGTMQNYMNGTNLSPYTTQGMQQIGQQGAMNQQTISNSLAARGLSYSPAAGNMLGANLMNTGNQQNQFLQGIPLLQHQLQQGNLQQMMTAFGTQPYGVNTTGQGTSTGQTAYNGTQQVQGNPLGGLFGGLGAGLMAPQGAGGQSSLSSLLAALGLGGNGMSGAVTTNGIGTMANSNGGTT